MREAWANSAADGLGHVAPPARSSPQKPSRGPAAARNGATARLEHAVLGHLPLGIAVIDEHARLLFWNEHAGALFRVPPVMAAEMPFLSTVLAGVTTLSAQQRDTIGTFTTTHIAAGDRTSPDSRLRLSLERDHRIVIQMCGIGSRRWMLVIDDRRLDTGAGPNASAYGGGDAWLDALTGLSNRRHFNQVSRDLADSAVPSGGYTLLMIDLDHFNLVNDTFGRPVGDALLCLVAQRLRREIRDEDLLARLGGDEFVILLTHGEAAASLAARVVDVLSRPFTVEGNIANISASVGVARFPEHGPSADDLMRHAELALYDAKSAGGRTWRAFEPAMAEVAGARRELETDLRRALTLGELSLAYQAQFNVARQTLTGFEALLRWDHPTRGRVSPLPFIPLAEELGCIGALGEWVMRTACMEAARWPAPLYVAVAVSIGQLVDGDQLFKAVAGALQAAGLAPGRLELQLTEGSLATPGATILHTLQRLRDSGVRIAMDVFGTGSLALSQSRSFPLSKITIDQSFIAGLGADEQAGVANRAIAMLGAALGRNRTEAGDRAAVQMATDTAGERSAIEGFLIGRPIGATEIDALLSKYAPAQDIIPITA